MMQIFELIPQNGRKSFYGKAKIRIEDDGSQTLISYGKEIINVKDDIFVRLFKGNLSHASSAHLKSFCGINKPVFDTLEVGIHTLNPRYGL